MSFAAAVEAMADMPIKGSVPTAGEVSALEALSAKWALRPGAAVTLGGFEPHSALNGAPATYVGDDPASGAALVRLSDGQLVSARADQLRVAAAGVTAASMPRPRSAVPPSAAEVAEMARMFRNAK